MAFSSKKMVDLAVAAGKKRQSPRTGFVHLFAEDENVLDTIPIYENFCFSFALLNQKTAEAVLEGKELLERLLCFQTSEGSFPVYLHEFPKCRDFLMPIRIAPILVQVLRRLGSFLGESVREKIFSVLEKSLHRPQDIRFPPIWEHRHRLLSEYLASKDLLPDSRLAELQLQPVSAEEWFECAVSYQLQNLPLPPIPYDRALQLFMGGEEVQKKGEPQSWPIEWALAERDGFSNRLLKEHPLILKAATLFPIEPTESFEKMTYRVIATPGGVRFIWEGIVLHSLSAPGGRMEQDLILFDLEGGAGVQKGGEIEAAFFCNLSSEIDITLSGRKGTIFSLGESVEIQTPSLTCTLTFHLLEGSGDFVGQISRANRPGQIGAKGSLRYEAFDWQIGLRTLRRSEHCRIGVSVTFKM